MIPYLLIGIVTVLGFVFWGLWGGVVAFCLSYFASFLVGQIALKVDKGYLPQNVRREIAESYLAENPEIITSVYPGMSEKEQISALEDDIEKIFQLSASESSANQTGLELEQMMKAAEIIWERENDSARKTYINTLAGHIVSSMY